MSNITFPQQFSYLHPPAFLKFQNLIILFELFVFLPPNIKTTEPPPPPPLHSTYISKKKKISICSYNFYIFKIVDQLHFYINSTIYMNLLCPTPPHPLPPPQPPPHEYEKSPFPTNLLIPLIFCSLPTLYSFPRNY